MEHIQFLQPLFQLLMEGLDERAVLIPLGLRLQIVRERRKGRLVFVRRALLHILLEVGHGQTAKVIATGRGVEQISRQLGVKDKALGGQALFQQFAAQFFRMVLDYTSVENVQFEDDDYYYYVKAVPKISVAAPDKKVKKINTKREGTSRPNAAPTTIKTAHGVSRATSERRRSTDDIVKK